MTYSGTFLRRVFCSRYRSVTLVLINYLEILIRIKMDVRQVKVSIYIKRFFIIERIVIMNVVLKMYY